MEELLTVKQVARRLNVSTTTVRNYLKAGLIAYVTLPKTGTRDTYRISSISLNKWIDEHTYQARSLEHATV